MLTYIVSQEIRHTNTFLRIPARSQTNKENVQRMTQAVTFKHFCRLNRNISIIPFQRLKRIGESAFYIFESPYTFAAMIDLIFKIHEKKSVACVPVKK